MAPQRAPGVLESGIFRDALVRNMTYVAMGLVVLFLATVAGALITGVMAPAGPRTVAERELTLAAEIVRTQGAVGESWTRYINALVVTGDLPAARAALAQARASVPATAALPDIDLSEARLFTAEKNFADAVKSADTAMKGYKGEYDARIAQGGAAAKAATEAGIASNYYDAALVKAYAYSDLRKWSEAIAMFDVFIKRNPTASDVLIDRGNAKVETGDKAGAEKDFREALRFVPYDKEAKAGLKRIGVAQ
jgi:tetratricopeptide (TPR) repeat protein